MKQLLGVISLGVMIILFQWQRDPCMWFTSKHTFIFLAHLINVLVGRHTQCIFLVLVEVTPEMEHYEDGSRTFEFELVLCHKLTQECFWVFHTNCEVVNIYSNHLVLA